MAKRKITYTEMIPIEDYYKIRQFIAEKFDITPETISDAVSQDNVIMDARRCFSFILVRHYNMSSGSSGKLIGNKNHATVLNYLRQYHRFYDSDKKFRKKADQIISFVKIHITNRPNMCPFCKQEISINNN